MKQNLNHLLLSMLAMLFMGISFTACSDDDINVSKNIYHDRNFQYEMTVPSEAGELMITIDSLFTDVLSIAGMPEWLNVSQTAKDDFGHPVLTVKFDAIPKNDERPVANLRLSFDDNNTVYLRVAQISSNADDANDAYGDVLNAKFVNNFEDPTVTSLVIWGANHADTLRIPLPWKVDYLGDYDPSPQGDINPEILADHHSKDGWELAMTDFNAGYQKNNAMFALYNKYTGKLRVFHWISNSQAEGATKYTIHTQIGSLSSKEGNHRPFFNSFQFGIPLSREKELENINYGISSDGVSNQPLFTNIIAPNTTQFSDGTLHLGWTSYDIDMSGYNADNSTDFIYQPGTEEVYPITTMFNTTSESRIALTGGLVGKIDGTFENPYNVTQTTGWGYACKVLDTFGAVGKGASDCISTYGNYKKLPADANPSENANADGNENGGAGSDADSKDGSLLKSPLAPQIKPKKIAALAVVAVVACVGAVCTMTSSIIKTWATTERVTEHMSGQINQTINAKIDLQGSITKATGNLISPKPWHPGRFKVGTSHVGEGVFNLAEDPVICIVEDAALHDNDIYSTMLSYLDRKSIKVCLNTGVLPEVRNVVVNLSYGVYPRAEKYFTDGYRKALGLKAISEYPNVNVGTKNLMRHQKKDYNVSWGDMPWCNKVQLHNGPIFIDGPIQKIKGYDESFAVVLNPLINTHDYYSRGTFIIPEFVVFLDLFYEYKNTAGEWVCNMITRKYLPQIKYVSLEEAKNAWTKTDWSKFKDEEAIPIGTLANDPKIEVYENHLSKYTMFGKLFSNLKAIYNR